MKLRNTLSKFFFLSLFFCIGCFNQATTVKSITPMETMGMLNNDFAVLLDVRETSETEQGMAEKATNLPTSLIESNPNALDAWLNNIPKDREIVVYCTAGGRSAKVAKLIAEKGWKVSNMGGYSDWVTAGLPVKKPTTK